jgi:hypothetical protein
MSEMVVVIKMEEVDMTEVMDHAPYLWCKRWW